MSNDPVAELLRQLLDAHDGLQRRAPEARRQGRERPVPLRRRRVAVLAAVIVAASLSTASALVLLGARSAPLNGRLPPQLLGLRYFLELGPDLVTGSRAWCVTLSELKSDTVPLGEESCSTPRGALIAEGGVVAVSPRSGSIEGWLLYEIVGSGVSTVQAPDGTRIVPIASDVLPGSWRAAITLQSKDSLDRGTVAKLTPLDARGDALSLKGPEPASVSALPVVAAARSRRSGCRLTSHGLAHLRVEGALTLRSALTGRAPINGESLLSCYSASFLFDQTSGYVAILLAPRTYLTSIPGMKPLTAESSTLVGSPSQNLGFGAFSSTGSLVAKRILRGWLLLQTALPRRTALSVLQRLTALT